MAVNKAYDDDSNAYDDRPVIRGERDDYDERFSSFDARMLARSLPAQLREFFEREPGAYDGDDVVIFEAAWKEERDRDE
jgi:hypothetical protein